MRTYQRLEEEDEINSEDNIIWSQPTPDKSQLPQACSSALSPQSTSLSSLTYLLPDTLVFFPFFQYSKLFHTTRLWRLLFPPPGMLFAWLAPSHQFKFPLSAQTFDISLQKKRPCQSLYISLFASFLHLNLPGRFVYLFTICLVRSCPQSKGSGPFINGKQSDGERCGFMERKCTCIINANQPELWLNWIRLEMLHCLLPWCSCMRGQCSRMILQNNLVWIPLSAPMTLRPQHQGCPLPGKLTEWR